MISGVPVPGCVMLPEENLSRFSSCLAIAQSRPPNDIWVAAKGSRLQSTTRSISSQPPALPRAQVFKNATLRAVAVRPLRSGRGFSFGPGAMAVGTTLDCAENSKITSSSLHDLLPNLGSGSTSHRYARSPRASSGAGNRRIRDIQDSVTTRSCHGYGRYSGGFGTTRRWTVNS